MARLCHSLLASHLTTMGGSDSSPHALTPSVSWSSTPCWLPSRSGGEVSRVRGVGLGFSGAIPLICSRFSVTVPRSYSTPVGPARARHGARTDAAFPLTLQGRLPHVAAYGAVSILGEVRTPLRPGYHFPVYASQMLFRHPSAAFYTASGISLVTRCLPRISMT